MEELQGHRVIVGDFNFAVNASLDRNDVNARNNNLAKEVVMEFIDKNFMTDIWRDRNPDKKYFTFKAKLRQKKILSRLDYIFIDQAIASWTHVIKILPGFHSDHSAVYCEILPFEIKKGKGVWCLNTSILMEKELVNIVNQEIDDTVKEAIERKFNPGDKGEIVKLISILRCKDYSQLRAKNRKKIVRELEEKIEKLEKSQNTDSKELLEAQTEYEKYIQQKVQGAMIRTGSTWYNESEHSSKYFYNLEKSKSGARGMNALLDQNGVLITDPKNILDKQY